MEFSLFLSLIVIPLCKSLDQASFYGNSFISLPLKEAKGYTDIHFKFCTYLPDALILLVAGTTDYCIISLDAGKIKLNINLGSGEFELVSPSNILYNNFQWHEVTVTRREGNLSLLIDNKYSVKKHLAGKFFELNVHYGLFVGGRGNFSDVFFGHQENFRGCLQDLEYNGILALQKSRDRLIPMTVVRGVTWNCAEEFNADLQQPISFIKDGAFMSLIMPLLDFMAWELEIKTLSEKEAILLYYSGLPTKLDTFFLEIWKGKLKASIKIGDNKFVDGINDVFIADGQWHTITIRVASTSLELNIDSNTKIIKVPKFAGYFIGMGDILYVGGIDINKRAKAASKGLKVPEGSFKGCIQHLKIGDRLIGLRDVHVSDGLLSGCVWQFPCLTSNPCSNNGMCVQQSLDSYQCLCQSDTCVNSTTLSDRGNSAIDLELLIVEPLHVTEGQNVLITLINLHIVLDFVKFGISESSIIFHIINAPEHGTVMIDVWPHEKNSFTLSDVGKDKIYYVHDGSEHIQDNIVMVVEFLAADVYVLPTYLQGRFRFDLKAIITPINDAPILNIPTTSILRVARGSKQVLSRTILHASDPDSSSKQLIYTVAESPAGHLEHIRKPGLPILSFSQEEIDVEDIIFIHNITSSDDSYLSLQVSDGIETSKLSMLKVAAFPHFWRIENNTGIIVMHEGFSMISNFNLSFISNAPSTIDQAHFYIFEEPKHGILETVTTDNIWKKTLFFNTEDLKNYRLRYRHTNMKPTYDAFQFHTSLNGTTTYTFKIVFQRCNIVKIYSNPLCLEDVQQASLTNKQLEYKTLPVATSASAITFVILSVPQYGYLFLREFKYRLYVGDLFTQSDLIEGNIYYKLHHRSYSYIFDSFTYTVMIHGCTNVTGNITFEYFPSADTASKVNVILKNVKVDEGGQVCILPTNLKVISGTVTNLIFNVTQNPRFGTLQIRSANSNWNETKFFTSEELYANKVHYIHDDSESKQDFFHFVASSLSENEDFQYVGVLYIDILLKNDNSPVRVIETIFNVVVNGQKLLTENDLKYADADLGTSSSDIIYTCRELSNGQLYNALNSSFKLTQFFAKDLDEGMVLFKHNGPKHGIAKLWVTDGYFYVEGILEIQASPPFIRSFCNRKLITRENGQSVISSDYLCAETNSFASDNDILYEVIKKPTCGRILNENLYETTSFTQSDINNRRIVYVHDRLFITNTDHLGLRISCKDAVNQTVLNIWILPANFWDSLLVKSSCLLTVEESTSAAIDKKILEVFQTNISAESITYYIYVYPQNGYLSIVPVFESTNNISFNLGSFTQALINENRLVYVHSRSNTTKDTIQFNVTNGIVWLNGLVLDIEIIPEHIYLGSNGITVNEGGTAVLTDAELFVQTDYYKSRMLEYIIVQYPSFGWIEVFGANNKINGFSFDEFINGRIKYVHDNSENARDEFIVKGIAGTKKSTPLVIVVNVKPINDNYPQLVNNTGLTMWEGGVSLITNSMLAAIDVDYPPDVLRYQVLGCWWGNVSLISETTSSLKFFTQELINKGMIVFRHQNGTDANFLFNVSDGLHGTGEYSFSIKAKSVAIESLTNSILHVFPLQKKLITDSHIFASLSDPNRTINYRITASPSLGRLITYSNVKENSFRVINRFTQADIHNSKIFYEHTHPFEDLYAEDVFVFNVEAHLTSPLLNQKFKIEISVSSGGLGTYIKIPNIVVDEGGIASVKLNLTGVIVFLENNAGLKSPILHASIIMNSLHGQVYFQHSPNLTIFTQQQLESGQIFYEHDHSDTLNDNIYFSLYILPGYIALCNVTIPILINPINDQPFKLITPAPHFVVVQGENHTITSNELATEDADTPPGFLLYDIISMPIHGNVILLPDGFNASHFTQEDINLGRVIYIHGGIFMSDMFHLRVWDGKFRPEFTVMNIYVVPVSLNVSVGLPLYLQQGSNVVLLSRKQFIVETNANINKIQYSIKEGPKHGLLYVKDAPAGVFEQNELDNDDVMYMQTDMTTANDSIKVFCYLLSGNTTIGDEIEIVIKVQPLMQIKNFTVINGIGNRLTKDIVDATPLAKLTNSDPHYTVTKYPQYCQIRKIIRSSGEKRNVLDIPVSSFSHEEVQSGLIYLVTRDVDIGWESVRDEMHFILAASIFQPASAKLKIIIKSAAYTDIHPTLASPNDPEGREGGMRAASPNMTRDYLVIVSMFVGVIILGIVVIVIIKCRTLEPDTSKEHSLQPIPLPRPPDDLMTSSTIKQHAHDGFTVTLSATLPQCKVTPLSETSTGYPYGIEEHVDDWSSCDASDPSCQTKHNIMLRRNQYWV